MSKIVYILNFNEYSMTCVQTIILESTTNRYDDTREINNNIQTFKATTAF